MSLSLRAHAASLVAGAVFSAGLVLAGMTQPTKVIAFLDVAGGAWDPSLGLVMAGAIGVHAVVFRALRGRASPLWADGWSLPTRADVDAKLLVGAAIFGLGWGLGGFCPGPGLVSLAGGFATSVVFVASMLGAMWVTARVEATLAAR